MKKTLSIVSIIMLAFILATFTVKGQVKNKTFAFVLKRLLSHSVPEIHVNKAATTANSYIFLDAREQEEYNVSHLPNATHIGYKHFKKEILNNLPKHKPLIVYCSIGKRSENITGKLINEGYTNVQNLYGGIFEWVNNGYLVYDVHNKQTQNVHAFNKLWGKFLDKGNKVY